MKKDSRPVELEGREARRRKRERIIIAVTVASSAAFALPMGYQTHMMIYGPGGYKFRDYVRFGGPLNLLVMAITVALAPLIWPF